MAHASFAIRDEASLNVLIPMGGRGEVFREAGYVFPKPLIKIAGRPMLFHMLDNLQLRLGDVIWLVVPHSMHGQYEAEFALLQRQYPAADIRVVTFKMGKIMKEKVAGAMESVVEPPPAQDIAPPPAF